MKVGNCPWNLPPLPGWQVIHLQGEKGLNSQHKQVIRYLVQFFYPPDQVGVTGGVLKKYIICNTAKRQTSKGQLAFCWFPEHVTCLTTVLRHRWSSNTNKEGEYVVNRDLFSRWTSWRQEWRTRRAQSRSRLVYINTTLLLELHRVKNRTKQWPAIKGNAAYLLVYCGTDRITIQQKWSVGDKLL